MKHILALPASLLPLLTPSGTHVQSVRSTTPVSVRNTFVFSRPACLQWFALLLPGAWLAMAWIGGGLLDAPAWAWLSVLLIGLGQMMETFQ